MYMIKQFCGEEAEIEEGEALKILAGQVANEGFEFKKEV